MSSTPTPERTRIMRRFAQPVRGITPSQLTEESRVIGVRALTPWLGAARILTRRIASHGIQVWHLSTTTTNTKM